MFRLLRFFPTRWWSPSVWKTWSAYVHWRLETYGVYYPQNRMNWHSLTLLLGQLPSYLRWLQEIDRDRNVIPIPHK